MKIGLELAQKQILTQNMIQTIEILQMSALELEAYIECMAMENPVIDLPEVSSFQIDSNKMDVQRKIDWLESTDQQNKVYYQQEYASENMEQSWSDSREIEENISEYLLSQILLMEYSDVEKAILEYLILSLDSRGWFCDNIKSVSEYFRVPEEMVLRLLKDVQGLDPAGVGARDLKECLLLQLERQEKKLPLVVTIVEEYLEEVAKQHIKNIAVKLEVSIPEVEEACRIIKTLNPKPGNAYSNREYLRYISPDVVIVKLKDTFEILVNEYQYPAFSINSYYQELLHTTSDAETQKYLSQKIANAEWIKDCIESRKTTLAKVVGLIVVRQQDFFVHGPGNKKPLRLSDIAAALEIHESTVSRALKGKYLQCAWGIYPLNYFLTSVATKTIDSGEEKTPEEIKSILQKIVDEENKKKPLSDQKICEKMQEHSISIARRTINKYRIELGIPDKNGRREWNN